MARLRTAAFYLLIVGILALLTLAVFSPNRAAYPNNTNSSESRSAESHDDQHDKRFWKKVTTDPVSVFTLILTAFTGILAFCTYFLWRATERLVVGAEDTSRRQLRAYLDLTAEGCQGLFDDDPIGIGLAFRNKGQTPAKKFNMAGIIDVLPYPLPDGYVLPPIPPRPTQDGVVFQGKDFPMVGWVWEREKIPFKMKSEFLDRGTTVEIYAHGVIRYTDIFDSEQTITFCFFLNPGSVHRDKEGKVIFQWAPVGGKNDFT